MARSTLRHLLTAMLAGAAAVGLVGALHSLGRTSLILWWASGVLAGLLIRRGSREALPMWAGAVAAQMALGSPLPQALMPASGLVLGPALLALYLERSGFGRDFARPADVLRFGLATAVAMLAPPTLTVFAMEVLGWGPKPIDPLGSWPVWWCHATIAVLLLAPAVATLSRERLRDWVRAPRPLLAALAAFALLVALNIVAMGALARMATAPLAMILAVYVMQRTDLVFGSVYCLLVTVAISTFALPEGPGGAFALTVAATAMLVRVLFAARREVEQQLERDEARYREGLLQAAAEERRRVGRDMHDTIGQELTSIALLARVLEQRARTEAPGLAREAGAVLRACDRATQSARGIARDLLAARPDR